jgi:Ca-activated chloride channel family protein
MLIRLMVAFTVLVLTPFALRAEQAGPVDLELVLAVDASASISGGALEFQLRGHAAAFRDPLVAKAISGGRNGAIAVTLVQYAGPHTLETVVPWTRVAGPEDATRFADRITDTARPVRDGSTAIGSAIGDAVGLFDTSAFPAERRTIDLVSNGFSNSGPDVSIARDRAVADGITINALVILDEYDWLDQYFEESVIGGPHAFVRAAENRETFAEAILQKLIEEIAAVPGDWDGQGDGVWVAGLPGR